MTPEKKSQLVPQLRFPEFVKDGAWNCRPLHKLAERITQRNNGGADLRPLTNSAEHGVVDQREFFEKDIAKSTDNYFVVERGDYVYNPRISSTAPVGPISKNRVGTGVVSPLYTVFRFQNEADDFFAHYFRSSHWHRYLKRVSNSGARHDRMAITTDDLMQMPMPTPSPRERRKIADCLDSLEDAIALENRKLELLKQHKQGLTQQMFPEPGETVPRLRFPEFADAPDWKPVYCGDIARVLPGYGFPDRFQGSKRGEFPFYKVSDISRAVESGQKYISDAANYINSDTLSKIRGKTVPPGTIIFAKIGEAIRSNRRVVTTKPSLIDNNAAGLKAVEEAASDEFLYYLWSNVSLIDHAGGVVPAVSKSALEAVPLCYTEDPDEQKRISDCLSALDTWIGAQLSKLNKLRAHKHGLRQRLFPRIEEDSI